jgi:plastocyanin
MRSLLLVASLAGCGVLLGASTTVTLRGTAYAGPRLQPDAVVWLDSHDSASSTARPTVVLDQRNLTFSPHVLAIRVGTTVELPNNDRVFHNVFSFHDGKRFDMGLYPVGSVKRTIFDHAGLSRVFCSIHPGMAAYVMSVDTPYFAVSDGHGAFVIPAVPPGSYVYHAWHAGGTTLTGSASAGSETPLEVRWP